jgi:hypothetical protein
VEGFLADGVGGRSGRRVWWGRRCVPAGRADVIASLDGLYVTGPDVGTTPADMAVIGERTGHVFCRPAQQGGSGDSSPHTATGTLAALRAVSRHIHGTPTLRTGAWR